MIGGVFPLITSFLTLGLMFLVLLRMDATLALLSLAVLPFLYVASATTRSGCSIAPNT